MDTPTPDNAARAAPVAWQERHRKSDGSWDNWRMCTKAYFQAYAHSSSEDYQVRELVPAATVAALEAEVREQSGWADKWKALHDAVSLAHEVQAKSLVRATERADAAERLVAELTGLLSDTAGNLRRMANDEFAECDQVRLEHVVNRIEDTLTGARAK